MDIIKYFNMPLKDLGKPPLVRAIGFRSEVSLIKTDLPYSHEGHRTAFQIERCG